MLVDQVLDLGADQLGVRPFFETGKHTQAVVAPLLDPVIPSNVLLHRQHDIELQTGVEHWGNNGLRMFARLEKGVDAERVGAKIKDLVDQHVDAWESDVFLQPISRARCALRAVARFMKLMLAISIMNTATRRKIRT